MTSEIADRRKHRRYRVDNSLSTSTNGIFQIIDISLGGFSFKCPPYSAIADLWDTDILTPMTQGYLEKLRFLFKIKARMGILPQAYS